MTNFLNAFDYYLLFWLSGNHSGGHVPGSEAWQTEEIRSYSYSGIRSG